MNAFLYPYHDVKATREMNLKWSEFYFQLPLNTPAQQYRADTARYHPMLMSIGNFDLNRPVSINADQYWIHSFKMCEKFDILFLKRTFILPENKSQKTILNTL